MPIFISKCSTKEYSNSGLSKVIDGLVDLELKGKIENLSIESKSSSVAYPQLKTSLKIILDRIASKTV